MTNLPKRYLPAANAPSVAAVPLDLEQDGTDLPVDSVTPEAIFIGRSNTQLMQNTIDGLPVSSNESD
jgi:hypothetical protein